MRERGLTCGLLLQPVFGIQEGFKMELDGLKGQVTCVSSLEL